MTRADVEIISNGSKFAGQSPDDLETLIEVLKSHNLDVYRFELGDFIDARGDGRVRLFGNFLDVSHVFNISGPADQLADVVEAIRANLARQSDLIKAKRAQVAAWTKRTKVDKHGAPVCVFCGRSGAGVQFVIFIPRFKPFGTACEECERTLPEGTQVPAEANH